MDQSSTASLKQDNYSANIGTQNTTVKETILLFRLSFHQIW